MKFKRATIKDFKRFTHLTIQGISETARLIMLAGPNGCGKSSFLMPSTLGTNGHRTKVHHGK